MLTLDKLLPPQEYKDIRIFGMQAVVAHARALTGFEQAWLDSLYPRPTPPDKIPEGKGSLSNEREPDFEDPTFRLSLELWQVRIQLAQIVLATRKPRWTDLGAEQVKQLRAEVEKLEDMDKGIRTEIYNEVRRMGMPLSLEALEIGEKNSSSTRASSEATGRSDGGSTSEPAAPGST